jgi:hypothetical protein
MTIKQSLPSLILLGTLGLTTASSQTADPTASMAATIGVYDSRAVAVAFIRSAETSEYLSGQMKDLDAMLKRAKVSGDAELAASLEKLGPQVQRRFHEQGFGAAPIDDIMVRVKAELPQIAKQAGVDFIVSKWELDYQSEQAEAIDLTEAIAEHFHPDEATLRAMRELMKQDPVPIEKLK